MDKDEDDLLIAQWLANDNVEISIAKDVRKGIHVIISGGQFPMGKIADLSEFIRIALADKVNSVLREPTAYVN